MICDFEIISYLPQTPTLSILPFILWGLGAALIGGTIIVIATDSTDTTTTEGKTMCVLGMQESGKTQFYMNLQGKSYNNYVATNKDDIPEFTFHYNGKQILVKKGIDINGSSMSVKSYYEKLIYENEIIFFLFNVKKYLNNKDYAFEVRARLEMIWRKYNDKSESKKHVVTLATHFDTLPDSEKKNVIKKLQESVVGKSYAPLFENNLIALDLTSKDFMKQLEEKNIF